MAPLMSIVTIDCTSYLNRSIYNEEEKYLESPFLFNLTGRGAGFLCKFIVLTFDSNMKYYITYQITFFQINNSTSHHVKKHLKYIQII